MRAYTFHISRDKGISPSWPVFECMDVDTEMAGQEMVG